MNRAPAAGAMGAKRCEPILSVVVPSVTGWESLRECLEALESQVLDGAIEVVVVDRLGAEVRGEVRRRFPEVRLVEVAPGTSIPRMRATGFRECRARIVGVIEDHVLVPPDWARRMWSVQEQGALVVGGSVRNAATERLRDWAVFLCEYSHCLTIPHSDDARWLPGNNVTYRRELLDRFRSVIDAGGWEDELHRALRAAGIRLVSRPDIVVDHKLAPGVGAYVVQRFQYARSFAALRCRTRSATWRFLYGCAALGLPSVLFLRTVRNVWRSGRHRAELLRSLPLQLPFVLAWAAGEVLGAWTGAGRSLERVR